ncbi:sporulation membrane protein YtaF [Thermoflavimicrobium dichotomicum]|uniref:Putative sporulation protein YtaF n=1 Tax=Thermoflavimicrobium dichotomicum TaxID=46223 RepID=A0A1I3LA30_9BACL|nr:sporulation membrane protein YtaF [Thermoflavimicrobium dichotomicum]SFI81597.1 putative sporulation protein YtaF [Thermoflavimicrobium dichotomicum]
MWQSLSIIWLAFAVSVDSFGVGITYGLRKIRIPFVSSVIIGICSGVVIFMAMNVGRWVALWFSPEWSKSIGAMILISLGAWTLYHQYSPTGERTNRKPQVASVQVWTLKLETLGLMIQILKTPVAADMDESGVISAAEAFLLGTALSLDAFGAGMGAAFMGLPPLAVAGTIAGMSVLFLRIGMWMGFRCFQDSWHRWLVWVPGIFLMLMGVIRLL